MKLEIWNGRTCIFGWSDDIDGIDVFKAAYTLNLLPQDRKVFLGSSRFFCQVKGGIMRTYQMRENWNGWHDVAAYSLPGFQDIGKKINADSSRGQHRDVVVIE